eukprot:201526_1
MILQNANQRLSFLTQIRRKHNGHLLENTRTNIRIKKNMKQPYDLFKNQDRDSCNNNKRLSKLYITVVFLMLHGLYIWVTVWWIYLVYGNIGSKHMKQILDKLTNKNGSLFGIIATIYAIKMDIYFFQVGIWTNLIYGVLSIWWSYLLFKNIEDKHMMKPPEQTENKNGLLYDITLKIYEIKMDIHWIMLVYVCYINGKICRIIRVFGMHRKSVNTNIYYQHIDKEGLNIIFSCSI